MSSPQRISSRTATIFVSLLIVGSLTTALAHTAGSEFRVNTTTANDQMVDVFRGIAMDSAGNFVITWSSLGQDGSNYGVYAQRYNSAGVAQGSEFRVNTTTIGNQLYSVVGMDASGNFVIAWTSEGGQDGSGSGIYAQRYNSTGVAQGGEFRVNTTTTNAQRYGEIAMDPSGNFVMAWEGNGPGDADGVFAQRYNSAGVPQGGEFRVNTTNTGSQYLPKVAMDSSGNFVVVWRGNGPGDAAGVFAQRYNSAGVPQGGEFRTNTTTTDSQDYASVAMDPSGNFVVTWSSYNQDGSGYGVYAQRYNAAGAAQGSEFRVNTFTASDQLVPCVSLDSAGNFVIAWSSAGQDGSGYGVYAQRYNSSGVAQGTEFRVSQTTTNDQLFPEVAMNGSGDFVVTWKSTQIPANAGDIYARQYTAPRVSVNDVTQAEGNTGTSSYTFTVSIPTTSDLPVSVSYATANGTATTASGDYASSSGTATIPTGSTSTTFNVTVNGDTLYEPDETFFVNLTSPSAFATISDAQGLGTIQNDEALPTLSVNDVYVYEPRSGTSTAIFTVTLSAVSSVPATVNYATSDGTATAASGDYNSNSGTLTFAAGETKKLVAVTVNADAVDDPNETFFLNLSSPSGATVSDSQGQASIFAPPPANSATGVFINEFRTRGANGTGSSDEFIELKNAGPSAVDISNWKFRRSDGTTGSTSALNLTTTTTIPSGTVLQPGQHYLIVNSAATNGYSLADYGGVGQANGDATYGATLGDEGGLAILDSGDNVKDQVGYNSDPDFASGYGEGKRLAPTTTTTAGVQFSYVRRTDSDLPVDTGDNSKDFVLVSTSGSVGTLTAILGAPGPQNTNSPYRNAGIIGGLVPGVPDRTATAGNFGTLAPNGILTFHRRYVNNTGHSVTKLRFRVYDITTLNSPDVRALYGSTSTRQAILRVLDRVTATVVVNGQTLEGLVLEQPPTQTAQGGGLNSTLRVESVLTTPLPNGSSADVQFRLGVEGGGYYRFFIVVEALP